MTGQLSFQCRKIDWYISRHLDEVKHNLSSLKLPLGLKICYIRTLLHLRITMNILKPFALSLAIFLPFYLSACQTLTNTTPQNTHNTPKTQQLRLFQDIKKHKLDNGLTVIIKEDRRAPVVMTQIWYGVGANDEPVGKGGLSHFLEHLMFKDTPKVSGDEFSRLISHYGGNNNAYTNADVTVYHEILPANRYPLALELEANRMKNVLFKPEQIQSERQVIQEERRVRTDDNPMAKAFETWRAFIYKDTPRARPVIGSMADINNLSMDDLQNWYQTWYVPNNATLVIVGDMNSDDALAWVKKYFGQIPKGAKTPTRTPAQFIHADDVFVGQGGINERTITIYEPVKVPSIILAWQVPSLSSLRLSGHDNPKTQRELLALGLFDDVLSGGGSSRFAKNLIKNNKVTSVSASYQGTSYGDGLFVVGITPKAGSSLDDTKQLVLNEIKRTMTDPITQKELDRSFIALKTALVFASEGVSGQAQILGELHQNNISFEQIQQELDTMPTITADEIKNVAKKYLTDERMYTAYILPTDKNEQ